jgi:predicted Ser/Thr protein kinase
VTSDDDERPRHDDGVTVELAPASVSQPGTDSEDDLEARLALARTRARMTGVEEEPVVLGHYRIVGTLGRGGMGVVYEALDENLGRVVAIKLLRRDRAAGSAGRTRLLREAQAAARLSHPNVAQVHEIGESEGRLYLVMERVHGETLRRWCGARERDWRSVLAMFLDAGRGLAAAHAVGLVHRDFKPDNVIVGDDGRPRVVDFGLARTDGAAQELRVTASHTSIAAFDSDPAMPITVTGTVMGTPAYMAPEQYAGGLADARADQFAFCVALFEALYGQRPFAGSTVTELAQSVSRGLPATIGKRERSIVPAVVRAAIQRGLAREPDQRHASMDELLARLAEGLRPARRVAPIALATVAAAAGLFALAQRGDIDETTAAGEPDDPWAAIVAASEPPAIVAEPVAGDPTGVTIHRLRNGLTVYIAPRPGEPRVFAQLVLRAGTVDERTGQESASYCLPTLLEEGTARLGSRDFALERPQLVLQHELLARADEVEDDAARDVLVQLADAAYHGSHDQIVSHDAKQVLDRLGPNWAIWSDDLHSAYAIDIPRHRLDVWVRLMAEMLRAPVFRGAPGAMAQCAQRLVWDFTNARARALVMQELYRLRGASLDGQALVDNARRIRLDALREFHATWYVPNNMALVLVGDISAEEALPILDRELGDWAPRELPARVGRGPSDPDAPAVRHRVEDGGGERFDVAWSLGPDAPPEMDTLGPALAGPHGLLAALTGDVADYTLEEWFGMLWIHGRPKPGHTLDETEAAFTAAIATIAEDRVPEPVWTAALASAELTRLWWAKDAASLAQRIGESYAVGESWPAVATRLAVAPTRADVVAAARWAHARAPVIVHQIDGTSWAPTMRPTPILTKQASTGRRSEFADALLEGDRTPLEPRFLVAGSHFVERSIGEGRVITVADEGPLFRLQWTVPIGVDHDPWVCDAMRAKAAAAELPGLELTPWCSTSETGVRVVGPAHSWPAAWPTISAWLTSAELDADAVREHVENGLRDRAALRSNPGVRVLSQYTWAVRGEHAFDARVPDDATLRARGAREIPRALAELGAVQPDLWFAGPDPDALQMEPGAAAPHGRARAPLRTRTVDRPLVALFDEPGRESVEVWVATPSRARDVKEELVALAYNYLHSDEGQSGTLMPSFMPHWYGPEPSWVPIIHAFVYRGLPYAQATDGIEAGLAELRLVPTQRAFEFARGALENDFRWYRVPKSRIPEHVARWRDPSRGDPRIEQWQHLPSLSYETFTAYATALGAQPAIIGVIADLSRLDRDALARYGTIVQPDHDIVRDPGLADSILFGFEPF